jgi:hypothetical protein
MPWWISHYKRGSPARLSDIVDPARSSQLSEIPHRCPVVRGLQQNRGGSRIYWLPKHSQEDRRSAAQGRTGRQAGVVRGNSGVARGS